MDMKNKQRLLRVAFRGLGCSHEFCPKVKTNAHFSQSSANWIIAEGLANRCFKYMDESSN